MDSSSKCKSSYCTLIVALAAYFLLWLAIPKASFLIDIAFFASEMSQLAPADSAEALRFASAFIASLPTIFFMAAQIGVVYGLSKIRMSGWQVVFALIISLGVTLASLVAIVYIYNIPAQIGRFPNVQELVIIAAGYYGPLKSLMVTGMMAAFSCVGYLVSLRVRDANLLLPVVIFAAFVDLWTVTSGPVSDVIVKAPEVVAAVSAPIPQVGAGVFVPETMIGPGDFLFMALVFAVCHRLSFDPRRNYWFVFGGMTIGMLLVWNGLLDYLPALITLGISVIAANWGKFKLSRQEKISTAVVAVVLAITLPLVWHVVRTATEPPPANQEESQEN